MINNIQQYNVSKMWIWIWGSFNSRLDRETNVPIKISLFVTLLILDMQYFKNYIIEIILIFYYSELVLSKTKRSLFSSKWRHC